MPEYEFHAFSINDTGGALTTRMLDDDIQASVRGFDMLRDNRNLTTIHVYRDGEPVLVRTRRGEKTVVAWASGRPMTEAAHLAANPPRRRSA